MSQDTSDWLLKGLKNLAPVGALIAFAWGAIHTIESKAESAIERVTAAVADVRIAQVRHEAMDDQRVAALGDRVTRVESAQDEIRSRQDGIEGGLAAIGLQAALPPDRRRVRPASPTGDR